MAKTRVIVVVDSSAHPQDVLGPLYAEGIIGAWNGYCYNEGGGVVAVDIHDPRALVEIDNHQHLTRLPSQTDPTPDAVKQKHIDKLHPEVKEHLKKKGKLDKDAKFATKQGETKALNGADVPTGMTGRELHELLHELYGSPMENGVVPTHYLNPDF